MERVVLVSPWLNRGSYRELKYAVCERFCGHWLLTERAWIRLGKPSEAIEYIYNPEAPSSDIYEEFQVTKYVINNRDEYFKVCSIPEEYLLDGVPHFEWAIVCELN